MRPFVLLLILALAPEFSGAAPVLKWTYMAQSNLYAPPLVADIHPSPGLEVVLSDSEARRLRCLDSTGHLLWEYNGHWTLRLTTAASLSRTAHPGQPVLLIGGGDGHLHCLDAKSGEALWRCEAGKIEWGTAIWADLDGDGRDEAVAGTETEGIAAFSADGAPLWRYPSSPDSAKPYVVCPIAAADVDQDGSSEILAVDRHGPFCLSGKGELRWAKVCGDEFRSTASLGDTDGDGRAELLASSLDDNACWCFDALSGEVLWRAGLLGGLEVASGSSIALGDTDRDGLEEIILSDAAGAIYCFDCKGKRRWVFTTDQREDAPVSLGDVDGDGWIDILAACGDHSLYCLSHEGELKWKTSGGLRFLHPPTLCDVDRDGKTDFLLGGSDRILRCYTLGGRYRPELHPWPSRRFDEQQRGSSLTRSHYPRIPLATSFEPLLPEGDFENAKVAGSRSEVPQDQIIEEKRKTLPRGWHSENGEDSFWKIDREVHLAGGASLCIKDTRGSFTFASDEIPVAPDLKSITATIHQSGTPDALAFIRWGGLAGVLREDRLVQTPSAESGWTRWRLESCAPPSRAKWVSLVCRSKATEGQRVWWDSAAIEGRYERLREIQPLVNQVGYEVGAPKLFAVQTNFTASEAAFEVLDESGEALHRGSLEHYGRVVGAYNSDWGYEYWRGDLTGLDAAGRYRVRVTLDGLTESSWPFEIGEDLLWKKTSRPAYRFFYYQRCGCEVPGFHAACHLDDAVSEDGKEQFDLAGGWHDAGDYNKYHNAPYVLGLATAYALQKEAFDLQDEDGNGQSDLLDEILWGGDCARRMLAPDGSVRGPITSGYGFWSAPELESDNLPSTGDERRIRGSVSGHDSTEHTAALAKVARYSRRPEFVEAAERGLAWALDTGKKGPLSLSAAVDLSVATGKDSHASLARELFKTAGSADVEVARNVDRVFGEDHSAELRAGLLKRADDLLAMAKNPFGVCAFGTPEKPNFFNTPADSRGFHVGTSSHLLTAANTVAQAHALQQDPRYLQFIYDQFNWILGCNPYGVCLMEGQGSLNPPSYHHRYTFGGVPRGAVPGSVVNGITWRDVNDDRPRFDMSGADIPDFESNEVWLPHNVNYLNALANLRLAWRGEAKSTPP